DRSGSTTTPSTTQPPHQSSLRKGRASVSGEGYFITTCIENREPILSNTEAAQVVIDSLRWLRDRCRLRLLGFVVMPDHIHVALALGEGCTLEKVMQSFKRFTSRQIHQLRLLGANSIRDTQPVATESRSYLKLWQTGYHDHLLRDRESFEKHLRFM